jgi:endo-1,4-beta-xylanase
MQASLKTIIAMLCALALLLSGCKTSTAGLVPLTGGPALPTRPSPPGAGEPGTLRYLASQHGLLIGAAVDAKALQSNPTYARTLSREFSIVVLENVMKFANIHPAVKTYNFTAADQLVDFATANGMLVRGHTLLWYREDPNWVKSGNYSKDQLIQILHDHIATVVGRYKGRIFAWDVVNEALDDNGHLRDNVWLRGIGPQYIDLAFQWAHQADPNALLFYNDYNAEGMGAKSNAIYDLVKGLKQRGVPIGGVGLQMHVTVNDHPSARDLKGNIQRLAALGLVVHITEMDVRLVQPASATSLAQQAQVYKGVLDACLAEAAACQALITWGLSDKYSWVPGFYPGFGSALLFDTSFNPKPAYIMLKEALSGK